MSASRPEPSVKEPQQRHPGVAPSLSALFAAFLRLGATAFGGPAMVAYIRQMAVDRKGWLNARAFDDGVALCQAVPGATAMQTAAYVGLRVRGVIGAATAFVGFGLPAFVLMLALSAVYARTHNLPGVISAFSGLQAIVVAIVANAAVSFGLTTLKHWQQVLITGLAVAMYCMSINPCLVVTSTALLGFWLLEAETSSAPSLRLPDASKPSESAGAPSPALKGTLSPFEGERDRERGPTSIPRSSPIRAHGSEVLRLGIDNTMPATTKPVMAILGAAAVLLAVLFVAHRQLYELAVMMLRIDLFAFGGGFASVPLLFTEVVTVRQWLDGPALLDGIVLGQVTPGPIVITATFVGYLLQGLVGAIVATLGVFLPSFLIVVVTAPHFDRLRNLPAFTKLIGGALCSFPGLLLVVAIHFAQSVRWDVPHLALAFAAFAALRLGVNILWVVTLGTGLSLLFCR
jgi:chromate transporter